MTQLFQPPSFRALDHNGDPVSGARLTLFVVNTTQPLTAYSDAAMTTPHAWPVIADSSGTFPAVYVNSSSIKVLITTPNGSALPGYPVDNVNPAANFFTLSDAFNDLQDNFNSLQSDTQSLAAGRRIVGEWDASSGAFPTTRPDGSAIQPGDTWLVSTAGTVDSVSFAVIDQLIAIDGGGATYAGNWLKWLDGGLNTAQVTPTGGSTARTLAAKLSESLSVKDFGATGDGSTDDTAAIQAAINASTNVYFPNGTYIVSSSITITSHNRRVDLGNAVIQTSGYTDWTLANGRTEVNDGRYRGVFNFIGGDVLNTTVTDASVAAYTRDITLASVAGVQVGDLVYLHSAEIWYDDNPKEEIARVSKINGSVISLDRPISAYDSTTYTLNAKILRPIKDCTITGGTIIGEGLVDEDLLNGYGPCGITSNAAVNFRVENVRVRHFQNTQIVLSWDYNGIINNAHIQGLVDAVDQDALSSSGLGGLVAFYGVTLNRSYGTTINNLAGARVRHLTDGAYAWNVSVSNCHATRTTTSSYRVHPGCHRWFFSHCFAEQVTHYGMQWEGMDVSIDHCQFLGADSTGGSYAFTDVATQSGDPARKIVITNSTFSGDVRSLFFQGNVNALVQGCNFSNSGTGTTTGSILVSSPSIERFVFKNNSVSDAAGYRAIQILGGTDGDTIVIKDNHFDYAQNGGSYDPAVVIQTIGADNDQLNVIIQGNIVPNTAASVLAYNHRTGGTLKISDNFAGSDIIDRYVPEAVETVETLTLTGSVAPPTTPVTDTGARFTRIGSTVFFQSTIPYRDTTGASGEMRLQGLPYSCARRTIVPVVIGGTAFGFGKSAVVGRIETGATQIVFEASGDAVNPTILNIPGAADTTIFVSGSYLTDEDF